MKRSLVAALVGIAFVPFAAHAQKRSTHTTSSVKPVEFGISGGAALPTSDLSDGANTGFNLTGTIGWNPQMIPLGIRVDGAYNRFGLKGGASGDIHFTSVTGNLVYKIPAASVSPYLIGGAGWYNAAVNLTGFGSGSDNHLGWNVGGGLNMPLSGFNTFIEARYNQVQGDGGSLKFIPITFGVMF
ncbi:MAG TPA: hypothetical protein VJ840_00270 [Gemmatimonadaceae bacterium]|nr:hypothetical protein [Gemmatimonadaceae bacterium]